MTGLFARLFGRARAPTATADQEELEHVLAATAAAERDLESARARVAAFEADAAERTRADADARWLKVLCLIPPPADERAARLAFESDPAAFTLEAVAAIRQADRVEAGETHVLSYFNTRTEST